MKKIAFRYGDIVTVTSEEAKYNFYSGSTGFITAFRTNSDGKHEFSVAFPGITVEWHDTWFVEDYLTLDESKSE